MQKKLNIYKRLINILTYAVLLLLVNIVNTQAQQVTYVGRPALDTITNGESIVVVDTSYITAVTNGNLENLYFSRNKISFHIDEKSIYHIPGPFTAKLYLKYVFTGYNGDESAPISDTLTINYDTAANYNAVDYRWFDLVKRSEIIIDSVVVVNGFANVKKILQFTNEISSFKTLVWDNCSSIGISNLLPSTGALDNNAIDTILVSWMVSNTAMVSEYDLEWTWVDSSAIDGRLPNGSTQLAFQNNATRVTLYGNEYNIPIIYDGGGKLLFRVRPVKVYPDGRRVEGTWSTPREITLSGFQRNLNWQSTVSYAEEGKRKIVLSYFDGTFRNRQTVTKDNTSNKTVVAESIYDFQGRPAIQVLPAPTLSTLLAYSSNFTLNSLNTAAYDRLNFDTIINGEALCQKGAEPMGDSSGAARYYSVHNPESGTGMNQYIPQAQGYPFTQTVYSLDNTGRIAAQSGVGPDHKIGTHDTRYYYGKPSQEELISLFGSEAGSASHFQKNMVRDANGQYSVSYVDLHGRTVATALAGNTPRIGDTGRVAFSSLPDNLNYSITENLLDNSIQQIEGTKITMTKGLLVPLRGDYTLQYNLTPPVLQLLDCNTDTICYDCLYDLNISIISDCGDVALDTTIEKIGIDTSGGKTGIDSLCNASLFDYNQTIILQEGAYTITKTLQIRESSQKDYYDSIYIANHNCKTFEDFLQEEIAAVLDSVSCSIPTCETCITGLGTFAAFRLSYFNDLGIAIADTAGYQGEVAVAWQSALENCSSLCELEGMDDISTLRREMLSDMHPPFGQYADSTSNIYSVIWPLSGDADYTTLTGYKNSIGRPAVVELEGGIQKQPQDLTAEEFAKYFEDSWAETLILKHPEYNRLIEAERLKASYAFDAQLQKLTSYQAAFHAGYITDIFNQDPATKNTALLPASFKNDLINRLNSPGWGIGGDSSVWFLASLEGHCTAGQASPSCAQDYINQGTFLRGYLDTTGLCAAEKNMLWQSFASYYIQAKQQLLYERIVSSFPLLAASSPEGTLRFVSSDTTGAAASLPVGSINETTAKAKAKEMLYAQISESCLGYVDTWMEKLSLCAYTTEMKGRLRDTLLMICRRGGDITHPAGASSVAPDSALYGSSPNFVDAVANFNAINNIETNPLNCNGYLISNTPQPYHANSFGQASVPYTGGAPDSCACANLNKYRQEWYYGDFGDAQPSFSSYLETRYGSYLTDAELNKLTIACNKGVIANCDTLEGSVIYLPPFIANCNTQASCADCAVIDSLNQKFINDYGYTIQNESYTASLVLIDSLQIAKNNFYQEFMNYHTGFSYNYATYISFLAECDSVQECHFKDTLLTAFRKDYYRPFLYRPNAAGCNAARWRSNYGGGPLDVVPLSNILDSSLYIPLRGQGVNANTYATIEYYDTVCFKPFTLESRMKLPRYGHTFNQYNPNPNTIYTFINRFYISLKNNQNNSFPSFLIAVEALTSTNFTSYILGNLATDSTDSGGSAITTQVLDDWFNYKVAITYDSVKLYVNDQLINAQYHAPFDELRGFYFNPYFGSYRADWIKITDSTGQVIMFEDFDKPCYQMSQIIKDPCQPSCENAWQAYGINAAPCTLNPCTPYSKAVTLPKLCGNTTAVFPQVNHELQPPCADSIGLAIQKATMRYTSYKDSLTNHFDSAYTARCLKAANYESFTLVKPQREYHYTLYYYDQAGNLVKTVAPLGLRLYRDSLAIKWGFPASSIGLILDSLVKRVKTVQATGGTMLLNYGFATQYRYNSLNQVIAQRTPDAGISNFWYDTLGRLAISQQSQQKIENNYSYTIYDVLGRIAEVGEKKQLTVMTQTVSRSPAALLTWMNTNAVTNPRKQITRTGYDFVSRPFGVADRFGQRHLRTRVSFSLFQDEDATQLPTITPKTVQPGSVYKQATYYTYDVHGNVDYLLQHYRQGGLFTEVGGANQYKIMRYAYDLISGKVNHVTYQPTWYVDGNAIVPADQYHHRYDYDAENRLTDVYVSNDSVHWERDASYTYYRHGPLARTELGNNQVQGLDYAYTLQGWLKGVNSTGLFRNGGNDDMGKDATPTASGAPGYGDNSLVAADEFGFALHYNSKDYRPAGGSLLKPFVEIDIYNVPITLQDTMYYNPLYNGNIAAMTTNIPKLTNPIITGRNYTEYSHFYQYDQLNRLKESIAIPLMYRNVNKIRFKDYSTTREIFSYDANGNIIYTNRSAILPTGAGTGMDLLNYYYSKGTNQLTRINDSRTSTQFTEDIDHQPTTNYFYNAIGNLIRDSSEGITRIAWTVYGKIDSIYKSNGTIISYRYDAGGNRILKKVNSAETIYVRDASGNVMSTYTNDGAGLWQREVHLYGSSRIGLQQVAVNLSNPEPEKIKKVFTMSGKARTFERGNKFFELSNHLGNVLVTVSDRRRSTPNTGNPALVSRYRAVVLSAQDYYAFGMIMPGRNFQSTAYRYGFNGKENDNEVKGSGNQHDYGERIYDPRVGRFLSLDPLMKKYPNESNYAFVSNSPLLYKDIDGRDKIVTITITGKDGRTTQLRMIDENYFEYEFRVDTHNPWDQTFERYRKDKHVDINIDLSNPNKNSVILKVSFGTPYKTDFIDGTMVGNALNAVGSALNKIAEVVKGGNESGKIKYGYRLLGSAGEPNEYTDGLPKPTEDSEFIDLGAFLNIVGNYRHQETLVGLGGKIRSIKGMEKMGNQQLGEFFENISTAIGSLTDALGEKKISTFIEDSQNKPKPVKRITESTDGTYSQGWKSSLDEKLPDTMEIKIPRTPKN